MSCNDDREPRFVACDECGSRDGSAQWAGREVGNLCDRCYGEAEYEDELDQLYREHTNPYA